MKTTAVVVSCLVVALACSAFAQPEYKPLEATYTIRGKSIIDPAPNEKADRISLWISGEAARSMYETMAVKPHPMCDGGGQEKRAGGLACTKSGTHHTCTVAIILNSGKTDSGSVC